MWRTSINVMVAQTVALATSVETRPAAPALRLEALFDEHHQRLYRLARRLSANSEDARDLVQETFLRVARAPSSVPSGRSGEEAWLVRILVNISRDRWRQTATRRRLDAAGASATTITNASDAESALVARSVVWQALATLPPRRRAVVVMHELEGLTVRAIAGQLGVAAVTVRWHLSMGRRELTRLIRGSEGEGS
jgi:RNA polymerase sigma factor (sigma-70 family)